jgi:hypothetical protein
MAGLFHWMLAIYPHQKIGISPSIEIDVVLYDLLEFLFSIVFHQVTLLFERSENNWAHAQVNRCCLLSGRES